MCKVGLHIKIFLNWRVVVTRNDETGAYKKRKMLALFVFSLLIMYNRALGRPFQLVKERENRELLFIQQWTLKRVLNVSP